MSPSNTCYAGTQLPGVMVVIAGKAGDISVSADTAVGLFLRNRAVYGSRDDSDLWMGSANWV